MLRSEKGEKITTPILCQLELVRALLGLVQNDLGTDIIFQKPI